MITFTVNYIALIYCMIGIICGLLAVVYAAIAIKNSLNICWPAIARRVMPARKAG